MKTKFNGILTLLLALVVQISFAQEKTVSGTVSDKDGALPGVSVFIKGTTKGTDTDFDGKYSIKSKVGDVLVFSYLGYETVEKTVGSSATMNITMKEGGEVLDEIVVTSYGRALNSKKSAASLARVDGKTIEQVPINSVDQVLQGAAAGVSVNTGSGQPGQSGTIIIRGISSLSGDIEPLFIIDGVPVDQDNFRSLNQNDIQTIDVLKDAAATSLYGNRGAGGVILVTTKRGKNGQKLDIKYRALYGVASKPKTSFSVMNSQQFLTFQQQNGVGLGGDMTSESIAALASANNTNWSDVFFRLGNTVSHELSFSSGTANSTSYTSINYFRQEGITLGSDLKRFSFRTNNTGSSANKRFNYSTNVTLNYSTSSFIVDAVRGSNTGGQLDNPFIVPYIGLPYLSSYNADGSLNTFGSFASGAYNSDGSINANGANGFPNTPFIALNTQAEQTDEENEIRAILGINADLKLSDNFTIGAQFGLDYINIQSLFITPPGSIRGLITPSVAAESKGTQFESTFRSAQIITNAFIRYDKEINDKLSLSAQVYGEYIYNNRQNEGFQAFGINPALPGSGSGFTAGNTVEFPAGDDTDLTDATYNYIPSVFSSESELALGSVLATLDVDYDGKYGLFASVRRDETSRFPNNPVGYFWSVAGRWNIDEEDFLSDSEWLSTLKLRASYGTTGNQNVGGFYQGRQQVVANSTAYQGQLGYFSGQINAQDLQWETKESLNIGFGFGMWNDRLSGELDLYNEKTVDLFGSDNRSFSETGFNNVTTNVGSLRNRGVDLQVSYVLLTKSSTNPWSVKVNANGNYNQNEVIDIPGGFTGNTLRNAEGRQARTWFLERWAGVDPSNGQPLYLDASGNITNVFSTSNRVYLDKNFDPTYTGGFGADISYKGFTLNSLFSFAADRWRQNSSLAIVEDFGLAGFANQSVTMLNAWTTPGQITDIPATSFGGLRAVDGDRYLEDASFLRLRNVSLSYSLDSETLAKTKFLSGLRVYVQGTNLITWTKWRGFDPESNNATGFFDYPVPRTFTLGFDLTF
ncbi:MAG: SusC/RagA family TonB-linked outer membrane protein [Flavobacteriaceae bacterium]